MSASQPLTPGTIAWTDLTVPDAAALRDFYQEVVGWQAEPLSMGDYDDFVMAPPGTETHAAGICHARGINAALPPQWIIYIVVEDLQQSAARCVDLGGTLITPLDDTVQHVVVRDPAGAVFALFAPNPPPSE